MSMEPPDVKVQADSHKLHTEATEHNLLELDCNKGMEV